LGLSLVGVIKLFAAASNLSKQTILLLIDTKPSTRCIFVKKTEENGLKHVTSLHQKSVAPVVRHCPKIEVTLWSPVMLLRTGKLKDKEPKPSNHLV